MNAKSAAVLMTRGLGLILIIMSFALFLNLPVFEPSGLVAGGWTSYSPLGTNQTVTVPTPGFGARLHDTYYLITSMPSLILPSVFQLLCGVALMWWSRPVGGWLARGLERDDERDL